MDCKQNAKPRANVVVRLTSSTHDFVSAPLENFNCKVGVITSLLINRRFSLSTSISIKGILQKVLRTLKIIIKMASGISYNIFVVVVRSY